MVEVVVLGTIAAIGDKAQWQVTDWKRVRVSDIKEGSPLWRLPDKWTS